MIKEGGIVEKNQELVKLDDTRYKSDYLTGFKKHLALSAMVARLQAEADGAANINFPNIVKKKDPALITLETNLFTERKNELKKQLDIMERSLAIAQKEFAQNK